MTVLKDSEKRILHILSFSLEAHGPLSNNHELYLLECLSQLYDQGSCRIVGSKTKGISLVAPLGLRKNIVVLVLLGRFTATAGSTGSHSPSCSCDPPCSCVAQLDVVRGIIYISVCQLITVSSASPHLHPFDALPLGDLIVPVLRALNVPILPSSSTKIRRSSPCHPTFFYLWVLTVQHRLPPTTPTRNPPCSSPAQRLPQTINDESRFQHPVDHFTSCILRSQSFGDVTTRNLSEDVLEKHSNVDPCHFV